ncbi:carboxypeptidase-like regulatory domain-containing protein [Streptomyces sp. NPDC003077]|uniref:carboxypeptidase-like regulatory domain-containing protein n=1 Tax=Streptomyces sp. NPDC003077 TaxID=3154443 RepID=UPI0033B72B54
MAVIAGVVVDADGVPVPDARVYVTDGPGPVPDVAALTDPDGRFALSAGADGAYTVECRSERGGASRVTVATVTVRGGMAAELRVRLEP